MSSLNEVQCNLTVYSVNFIQKTRFTKLFPVNYSLPRTSSGVADHRPGVPGRMISIQFGADHPHIPEILHPAKDHSKPPPPS